MSSTNKTTNYDLSQYIGSDKPTYLGDYNGDMLKIDAGMHTNAQANSSNTTKIGDLDNLTTNVKTNLVSAINEVDANSDTNSTNMGSLSSLNTADKTTLVNAINEVLGDILNFNLTSYKEFLDSEVTMSNGTLTYQSMKLAKNSDGSLCKLYGSLRYSTSVDQSTAGVITITNTGLAPTNEFRVSGLGLFLVTESGSIIQSGSTYAQFKTNGDIEIGCPTLRATRTYNAYIWPCLLYVKDFGDTSA